MDPQLYNKITKGTKQEELTESLDTIAERQQWLNYHITQEVLMELRELRESRVRTISSLASQASDVYSIQKVACFIAALDAAINIITTGDLTYAN